MRGLYPNARRGQVHLMMLEAVNACARLRTLGIPVHAAHCHTGRVHIIADVPPAVGIYTHGHGIEITRPSSH